MNSPPPETLPELRRFARMALGMHARRLPAVILLTIANGLFSGCSILLLVPLLELISTGEAAAGQTTVSRFLASVYSLLGLSPTLEVVLCSFLALITCQTLFQRKSGIYNTRIQHELTQALQARLFKAVAFCRWSLFTRKRTSDFMHALTSDVNRVASGVTTLFKLGSAILLAIVHLVLAIVISPGMAAVTLTVTALMWPLLSRLNRMAKSTGQWQAGTSRNFYHCIEQQLAGMKEIKSLGAEERQVTLFSSLLRDLKSSQLKFQRASANVGVVMTIGSALFLCGMLWIAVRVFQTPPVELLVLVLVFSRLIPRLRSVQNTWQQLLNMLPAFAAMTDLQDACEAQQEVIPTTNGMNSQADRNYDKAAACATIQLHAVGFRYDSEQSDWALRGLNATLPAHSTTALVGPSGAGKSTTADLLMGLLLPEEGEITIDGQQLASETIPLWRRRIGYVPQETFLLNDTVRNNLLWARPDADNDALNAALQLAAADQFVSNMPMGLETMIGDRGVRLSGGERQRLALARALLRQPDLLILDEATSHLDADNQIRIQTALQRMQGQLSVVLIAHRLSTIRHADQIIVLDRGRIAETGTYDELTKSENGLFQKLVQADGGTLNSSLWEDHAPARKSA